MSFIVAALAKSRGESVPPPPPEDFADLPPRPGEGAPAFTLKPYSSTAKPTKTFPWFSTLFGAAVLAAVGTGVWWFMRPTPVAPQPPRHVFSEKMANTTAVAATGAAPVAPQPSEALNEKVQAFSVSAAVAGESQRVIVAGKLYHPGDRVAEGLVLQEVYPGLIVFRDTAGALYTRRF